MIAKFVQDKSGATAVEYGLIVAVLSLVIVSGVSMVMTSLQTEYTDLNSTMNQALR